MKLIIALLAALFSTGCISDDLRAIEPRNERTPVLAIAHRGASAYAPENTFAAFDKAQQLGASATETDIQLSKDNVLVLFHDDSLDTKTNLKGSVKDHTWDELQSVDLAPWFAKQAHQMAQDVKTTAGQQPTKAETSGTASTTPSKKARAGVARRSLKRNAAKISTPTTSLTRLLSLDDLFERYGMTFAYNLEIKSTDDKIPELVLKTVKEYGVKDNVTVTSFHLDQLSRLRKLDQDVLLCYLTDDKKNPDISAEILRAKNLGFNEVSVRAGAVTPEHVKEAKAAKLMIMSWGVQNDGDMVRAAQAGVAGMTTNWPDRLLKFNQSPIER